MSNEKDSFGGCYVQEGRVVQGRKGGALEALEERIMKEVGPMSTAISEMAKEFSRKLSDSLKPLSGFLNPLYDIIQKQHLELGRVFEQYRISEQVAEKFLNKYKLFLSPSLDIRLVHEIARIAKNKGNHRAEINRVLVQYFVSNNYMELEELIKGWKNNELFRPRTKILRDCLTALRAEGKGYNPSNVVLPTLIAQIDGIRQSYLEKKGYSHKLITTKKSKRMCWVDINGQIIKWKKIYENTTRGDKYMTAACEIFVHVLFESSSRGSRSLITFNRHKIMHGEYTQYGRTDNMIRAFLVLDFLCHLT